MAEDNKTYECGECGEVFDRPIDLAKHVKSEHPKAKSKGQGGSRAESFLTEDDIAELREQEKHVKALEMQVKEARLNAELRKLQVSSEPPKERTWILPDGTSFQGSSADYREMLQLYLQTQVVNKKSAPAEDSTTIKALLDRIAELEKITTESKMKDIENKLNYIAGRDPLTDASDAIKRFNEMASQQGLIKAGTSVVDEVKLKHADVQTEALKSSIQALSKKIDRSMERASKIETQAMPILSKIGDLYVQDFAARRRAQLGEPEPISDHEIAIISKNLEKNNIEQEISNKPAESPENKPEPKSEPPKMKEFSGINTMPGRDLSGRETE